MDSLVNGLTACAKVVGITGSVHITLACANVTDLCWQALVTCTMKSLAVYYTDL